MHLTIITIIAITAIFSAGTTVACYRLYLTRSDKSQSSLSRNRSWGFISFVVPLVCACLLAFVLVTNWVLLAPNEDVTLLGQRGDIFGGFLNPILTFFTFAAFLYTIWLQRSELQESREQFERSADALVRQNVEIRHQNYQSSFFQLLTIHNDIVNSLSVTDPVRHEIRQGREAFQAIYSMLCRDYRGKRERNPRASDEKVLRAAYASIYRSVQGQLGHYLRFLYNTILILEDGPDATKYIKLLRAQLSNQELLVIFYNCAAFPAGKNFKIVAERHRLFDNMPAQLFEDEHGKLLDDSAFGPGGYDGLKKRSRTVPAGSLLNPPRRV